LSKQAKQAIQPNKHSMFSSHTVYTHKQKSGTTRDSQQPRVTDNMKNGKKGCFKVKVDAVEARTLF
jgi:hypothetical protein